MEKRSYDNVQVDPESQSPEIKTIEVTVCSDSRRPESTVISRTKPSGFIDLSWVKKKSSHRRRDSEQKQKSRRDTTKSECGEYRIDTDAYLHEDKIREIMNIDQLEETLDEVLTISSDDLNEMFSSPRSTEADGQ